MYISDRAAVVDESERHAVFYTNIPSPGLRLLPSKRQIFKLLIEFFNLHDYKFFLVQHQFLKKNGIQKSWNIISKYIEVKKKLHLFIIQVLELGSGYEILTINTIFHEDFFLFFKQIAATEPTLCHGVR